MSHYNYQDDFKRLYVKAVKLYGEGNYDKDSYFDQEELELIAANGWRVQDFFDYGEDFVRHGTPSYEVAQSIEQVRREYFIHEQKGIPSESTVTPDSLPEKSDEVEGIAWLPRIMPKAWGKIKGELDNDIMYGCGGDRNFLQTRDIHPAEFLRVAWKNIDNPKGIVEFVQSRSSQKVEA
ncbi:MAG: DUF5069 domain-containing protein [Verrucomicrobiota bacterium]